MIPKIIHYCWFGRNPKPKLAEKCIKSWKKYCKSYEIIEWNEDNFDISECPLYVRQAYKAKKWAFVTDYVRLKVVYNNGGIYLDTDVQIIKPLDDLLGYNSFFGFQNDYEVNTGLGFGSIKGSIILFELLQQYENIPFLIEDGEYDILACPTRNTEVFLKHGLIQNGANQSLDDGTKVFAAEYFCPISYETLKKEVTKNTYSIHWFSASWHTKQENKEYQKRIKAKRRIDRKHYLKTFPNRCLINILGNEKYENLKQKLKK